MDAAVKPRPREQRLRGCLWLAACPVHGPRSNHAPGRAGAIRGRAADWRGANGNSNSRPAAAKLDRDRRRRPGGRPAPASAVTRPLASRATASSRPTSTRRSVRRHLRSPSNTRASCRARGPGRASARGPHEVAGFRAAVCRGPRKASPCRRSTLGPRFAGAHKIGFGFGFGLGGRS